MNLKQARSKWLAVHLMSLLRINARPKFKDIYSYIKETFCLRIHRSKAYKGWMKTMTLMEGSERDQYKPLQEYSTKIQSSNFSSKCWLAVSLVARNMPRTFKGLYMCIKACKEGFLQVVGQ